MSFSGRNLSGRAYLIQKLRERDLSERYARYILNAIFEEMAEALGRGEKVEFPFGYLHRVGHCRKKQRGWFLDMIMIYQQPYTVAHVCDEEGNALLGEARGITSPGATGTRLKSDVEIFGR